MNIKDDFERKETLLLKAAETDEGIRYIMESIPGSPKSKLVFETLQKYRKDGPMLLLTVTCFSIRPKGKR